MEEYLSGYTANNNPMLARFHDVMVGIAIFIGFAVVCLSMYMAVLQRTREIGILKSLGASRWYVINIVLMEAGFLGFGGENFCIGLSYVAERGVGAFGSASVSPGLHPSWVAIPPANAPLGSIL